MCNNNQVIDDNVEMVNAYRCRAYADKITLARREKDLYPLLWEKGIEKPIRTTEGFYLVHESLFDEILKPFTLKVVEGKAKDENNKSRA